MRKTIKSYWLFFLELCSERVLVRLLGPLWGLWGILVFFRDELGIPNAEKLKAVNIVLQISSSNWLLIGFALLIVWITESSFRALNRMRLRNQELSKVDSEDLERMLNGRYCFERFLFGRDGYLCGRFTGAAQLEELRDNFFEMEMKAPKLSIAHIRLSFMKSRGEQGMIRFFFRDKEGKPQFIENIYQEINVPVNEQGKIAIKFVCSAGYALDENASLDVWAHGWTK